MPHWKRKRRRGPARVGDLLPNLLGGMDGSGKLGLARLWRDWAQVLGPEIARMARPMGTRGSTLILGADDPVVKQELSYFSPEILERVNGYLTRNGGHEVFDKVRFEMIDGRVPLDGYREPDPSDGPLPLKKPSDLGGKLKELRADSPVGRCYRAYVRMFE